MLSPVMQDALNKQLNAEFGSSYLYLSMAAWLENQNLSGMAHWMRLQADEEWDHAMRIFDFIHDRDGRVVLSTIETPLAEWSSVIDVFEASLAHEQKITGQINELVDLALQEKDHAANAFLQWFVSEQVEEEATVKSIVDKLKLAGENGVALFMLDTELGRRTESPNETP
ncbi:MAG: ferritin [Planctomycetes bacterium]|nr:ferritin [Planctomycetota bacterium]